jgi:hypothetical protein
MADVRFAGWLNMHRKFIIGAVVTLAIVLMFDIVVLDDVVTKIMFSVWILFGFFLIVFLGYKNESGKEIKEPASN